ncbi:MAG: tetratricopeptide repeat protein [Ktedonobacteraceae bacterium]|nr:tetratricopeptide repeat protein [Ktedonobacteraceae bacterium]
MSRRLGLIVGVNQYQDATFRPLQFAEKDARALAQWLVNIKGGQWSPTDVQLVQGEYATRELVEALITQLCLTVAESGDLVLMYFAGHAYMDEKSGDGYLALANTYYYDTNTGLHLRSFAQRVMAHSRASHILCIFDCFQTGRLWSVSRTSPYDSRPLLSSTLAQALAQQGNRLFLCSCRGNDIAPEAGERDIGLFMYRALVGLSGLAVDAATQQVTLQRLLPFLSSNLAEQQRPVLFGQEQFPFVLVGDSTSLSILQHASPALGSSLPPTQQVQGQPSPQVSPTAVAQLSPQSTRTTSGYLFASAIEQHRQQQCQLLLDQVRQCMSMQNPAEAYKTVEYVLQVAPRDVAALILKAQLLSAMGHFQQALAVVEQVVQLDPNNVLAWNMRAVLLSNLGQYQIALASIEHSLELGVTNAETHTIKNNIMAQLATAQSTQRYQPQIVEKHREGPLPLLRGAAIDALAFLVGAIGSFLLLSASVPSNMALALQSAALAVLCVNAATGAYRYGFVRLLFVMGITVLATGSLGTLYTFGYTRILAVLKTHPMLLLPTLFCIAWVVLVSILPLLSGMVGFIIARATRPTW